MDKKKILLTGGTGYIGSHIAVKLIEDGYNVVLIDNLSNSSIKIPAAIKAITGVRVPFYRADCCDKVIMYEIFKNEKFDAVIHLAGLKAVGESMEKPKLYHDNNVGSLETIVACMKEFEVRPIVFSSSATVYGLPEVLPITEESPVMEATNPYGQTKIDCENLLRDELNIDTVLLRYFNPIGAHPSGLIGENPSGVPNNLLPRIIQVALNRTPYLTVFGNDYDTPDGTGIRDYFHIEDLARGHVLALEKIFKNSGCLIYNLGSGTGVSVLELVRSFEEANGIKVKYDFEKRRPGDINTCYASIEKAANELNWFPKYSVKDACRHAWNFVQNNKMK